MPKNIANSNKKSKQCIPKQTIKMLSKELSSLKIIIKSQDNPQQLPKQLLEAICLMQTKLGFQIGRKPEQEYHDYIQQFYEVKISGYERQLSKLKNQNQQLRTKLKQVEYSCQDLNIKSGKGYSQVNQQYFETCTSQFNRISEMTKVKQDFDHCSQIIKQNQDFIAEQKKIIDQLKQQLYISQKLRSQLRAKHLQKIKDFDFLINKNDSTFKNRLKQFQIETNAVYNQIGLLERQNIKNIQVNSRLDEQVGSKCQQIKRQKQKTHQIQMQVLQKEQQLAEFQRVFYQNQSIAKISEAESKAYLQKINHFNQQWQIKIENKQQQIRMLQKKLNQSHQLIIQKDSQSQIIKSKIKSLQQQNRQLQLYKNSFEQKKQSIQQDLSLYTNQIYELNQELNKLRTKKVEYERLLSQSYQKIELYDRQLNSKDQYLNKIILQHSTQKQQLKEEIMKQFDSLKMINSKLESKTKRLQAEKLQLKQEKQYLQMKVKSLTTKLSQIDQNQDIIKQSIKHSNCQNDHLKQAVKNLQSDNQNLMNTNQALQKQLTKIQKQLEYFHEFDSSRQNSSVKMTDLQHKILQSDQCIKGMSSQIDNLLQHNRLLRDRISEQEKASQNNNNTLHKELGEQLKKRDAKIKQLMGKVNILQDQLRESDKSNSCQKNRLSFQIKELQTILSNRNRSKSPVKFY